MNSSDGQFILGAAQLKISSVGLALTSRILVGDEKGSSK